MQMSRMDAGASGTEGPTDVATEVGPGRHGSRMRTRSRMLFREVRESFRAPTFPGPIFGAVALSVRSTFVHSTKGWTPCLATSIHPGM